MENVTNKSVYELDRQFVFHSWSIQNELDPLVLKSAAGCHLWDYHGKEYLDFSSQLVNTNIGHQHPKVISAIKLQAELLATVAPAHANYARGEAAKKIIRHAPKNFKKVFFTNGGADANENAIRIARAYSGKDKILSAYRSYHGNTGSSIVATGDWRRIPNDFSRGHAHFFNPFLYRSDFFSMDESQESERALYHLERIIQVEGENSIAGILLESIPGTAGILMPPKGYMEGVRSLCDKYNILLILDEVMAGFGRTGKWFAFDHFNNVIPDLITFAKGVNSGYVPAGGVILSEKICDFYQDKMFAGGLTYSGHPLAMAAIVATIDVMEKDKIVENAELVGNGILADGLKHFAEKYEIVGEVRGIGMFWAIELVSNRVKKTPLGKIEMTKIKSELLDKGLLPFIVENRIHVTPPCIIQKEQVKQGLGILESVLARL